MPTINTKYKSQAAADRAFHRLRKLGYHPYQTLVKRGLKIHYVVSYKM